MSGLDDWLFNFIVSLTEGQMTAILVITGTLLFTAIWDSGRRMVEADYEEWEQWEHEHPGIDKETGEVK